MKIQLGRSVWLSLVALLLLSLTACASSSSTGGPSSGSAASGTPVALTGSIMATPAATAVGVQGQLTIFAAASLTDAFKQIGANIEQANPGTKISFNFAGSPTLRTQLAQGARAELFASADEPNMQGAQQDGSIAGTPQIFAQNRLVLITPASGTLAVTRLQDLAKPNLKLILAQQNVPVGNYARQAFLKMSQDAAFAADFNTRALANLASEETDVKAVITKVQLGEADAGIVYATDVTPSVRSQVKTIAIPDQFNVIARYPIAVVKGAANASGAQAFIDYVLSPAGQGVLKDNGFIVSNG